MKERLGSHFSTWLGCSWPAANVPLLIYGSEGSLHYTEEPSVKTVTPSFVVRETYMPSFLTTDHIRYLVSSSKLTPKELRH